MKTWITVLCAVALLAGCAKKKDGLYTTWYENGQKKDETTYKDGNLVTATVWKPNGEKCPDTNVVNGNGIVCYYHENGQKADRWTYKNGKTISRKEWDEDGNPYGQDQEEGDQKPETKAEALKGVVDVDQLEQRDDLMYFKEKPFTGVSVMKYPNGKKEGEGTHKDGKLMTATVWKPNGEKCPDTNLVNGTGIVCGYHENGQKNQEVTLKNGKLISAKGWDEDGNLTREYPKD